MTFLKQNSAKLLIGVLLVVIVWFSVVIIRLENYHHAVQVGFCQDVNITERDGCLSKIQTRVSPVWHLFYALKSRP